MQQWWRSVPRALLNIQVRNHHRRQHHQQHLHHDHDHRHHCHHHHHHHHGGQCQGHSTISRSGTIVIAFVTTSTFTVATHFMMMTIDNCCLNVDNDKNLLPLLPNLCWSVGKLGAGDWHSLKLDPG